ncbi:MAG: hypothetical protein ACON37_08710 [Candidatus Puniceispirillaceae bacterium]
METYKDYVLWAESLGCSVSGDAVYNESGKLTGITVVEAPEGNSQKFAPIDDAILNQPANSQWLNLFCRRLGLEYPKAN